MRVLFKRLDGQSVSVADAQQATVLKREEIEEQFDGLPEGCEAVLTLELDSDVVNVVSDKAEAYTGTSGEHIALRDYDGARDRLIDLLLQGFADFSDYCLTE